MNENQPSSHQPPEGNPAPEPGSTPEGEAAPIRYPAIRIVPAVADERSASGIWVYAAVDAIELERSARAVCADYPELNTSGVRITDSQYFGDFTVHPDDDLSTVARVARGIHEHGDAFAFWAEFHDADPDMLDAFEAAYQGEWGSPGADRMFARSDLNETASPRLADYLTLDYESIAELMWRDGRIYLAFNDRGKVWIFDAEV